MTTTTDASIRDSSTGTLTALRALAAEPSAPIVDALVIESVRIVMSGERRDTSE
jgi:hypothetical protein